MILRGILDFSLGGFLCLRGFAPLGELHDISDADPGFQRKRKDEATERLVAFLRNPDSMFFPEVVLSANLDPKDQSTEEVNRFVADLRADAKPTTLKLMGLRLSYQRTRYQHGTGDRRGVKYLRRARLVLSDKHALRLSRIDGNHRLSAVERDPAFREINAPFCLVLFRSANEADKNSRVLFHNINFKQQPLSMEEHLRLIFDDEHGIFPDKLLKEDSRFGWPFYIARKLHEKLDADFVPYLAHFLKRSPRTFLLHQFEFLISHDALKKDENAVKRLKSALAKANSQFAASPELSECRNQGLLAALIYFELSPSAPAISFTRWVLANHLHLIAESNPADLVAIFEQVLAGRKHTIFVSMPFGKDVTENHFKAIQRVAKEINTAYPDFKPPLKVERVDFLQAGTSFNIRAKIDEFMSECGLLIGDLTYCNPNVYHEIGFMDGKARAEQKSQADVLLFLDESVATAKEKFVGFNLRGTKHIPFKQTEDFARLLRENLELHFRLKH